MIPPRFDSDPLHPAADEWKADQGSPLAASGNGSGFTLGGMRSCRTICCAARSKRSGAYEPWTLYVLRDAESLPLARASHDPSRDLILQADGHWLLAPGWRGREAAPPRGGADGDGPPTAGRGRPP